MVIKRYSFKEIYKLGKPFRFVGIYKRKEAHIKRTGHRDRIIINKDTFACKTCGQEFDYEWTSGLAYPDDFILLEDLGKKPTWL